MRAANRRRRLAVPFVATVLASGCGAKAQPGPETPARTWVESDGSCWRRDAFRCPPPDEATCNPPPPFRITCPDEPTDGPAPPESDE